MANWSIEKLTGKILKVDLSRKDVAVRTLDEETYKKFLGGRGLNQLLLFKNIGKSISPLNPNNPLLFSAGMLVGTAVPGATRLSIDSKNYFTNGIGSANGGGNFARELKNAGFGTIIITGKAKNPVYLSIHDKHVSIKDADHLWGKTVDKTVDTIQNDSDRDVNVLCIGPAGENLVRGACVMIDKSRAAAKCGLGAIMGSKNLKAIEVNGNSEVKVKNRESFEKLVEEAWRKVLKSKSTHKMNTFGTVEVRSKNKIGGVPIRHYQDGFIQETDLKKIDRYEFKKFEKNRFSAINCPINCRSSYKFKLGEDDQDEGEAMEANTIQDFGFKLNILNPSGIIKSQLLCNRFGIDMDTAGETIAWAFECYQKGIIDEEDTNGLELTWGNYEAVHELIKDIANRRGFGDILAEGVKKASEQIGKDSGEFAMEMKGQDLYETIRMPKGYSLGAALSTRGGGHCSGSPLTEFSMEDSSEQMEEIYGVSTACDPSTYDGKAKLVAYHERLHSILNSLGVCFFSTVSQNYDLMNIEDLSNLISAGTGWKIDRNKLIEIGERIHTLERYFNYMYADFDKQNDFPPERFFKEKIKSGPYKGEKLEKSRFEDMLSENYNIHKWDDEGIPTEDRLEELGLKKYI
ncbi:MAG: aldehyde ferredoxin oxidoreductase family protein [Promethearchaeia archaeon]